MNHFVTYAMRLLLVGALPLFAACTTVKNYPSEMNKTITTLGPNDAGALAAFTKKVNRTSDGPLFRIERARIAQLIADDPQDYQASMRDFAYATETLHDAEFTRIDLSVFGSQATSLAVNEKTIPYLAKLPDYEFVFLHHFQAMNFLALGDIEAARIELKRANQVQQDALARRQRELRKLEEEVEEHNVSLDEIAARASDYYNHTADIEAQIRHSFENAYTYYLSGLLYEADGLKDEALIDYARALNVAPHNPFIQERVYTLARELRWEDNEAYAKVRGLMKSGKPVVHAALTNGHGRVVVVVEDGFVPQRQEVRIPIPLPDGRAPTFAFPYYRPGIEPPAPVTVTIDNGTQLATQPICYVRAMAVKALKEQLPAMMAREVIRTVGRAQIMKEVSERTESKDVPGTGYLGGFLGNMSVTELGMNIGGYAIANADQRSWYTLPDNIQIMHDAVPAGTRTIQIAHRRCNGPAETTIEVEPGKITLVRAVEINGRLKCTAFQL